MGNDNADEPGDWNGWAVWAETLPILPAQIRPPYTTVDAVKHMNLNLRKNLGPLHPWHGKSFCMQETTIQKKITKRRQ